MWVVKIDNKIIGKYKTLDEAMDVAYAEEIINEIVVKVEEEKDDII